MTMWGFQHRARATSEPSAAAGSNRATARTTIPIFGLSCGGGGALTAERALARTPGVVRAYVNPATEMAYVEFDPNVCTVEQLAKSLGDCGFQSGQGQE